MRPDYAYAAAAAAELRRTNGSDLPRLADVTSDGLKMAKLEPLAEDLVSARTQDPAEGAKFRAAPLQSAWPYGAVSRLVPRRPGSCSSRSPVASGARSFDRPSRAGIRARRASRSRRPSRRRALGPSGRAAGRARARSTSGCARRRIAKSRRLRRRARARRLAAGHPELAPVRSPASAAAGRADRAGGTRGARAAHAGVLERWLPAASARSPRCTRAGCGGGRSPSTSG